MRYKFGEIAENSKEKRIECSQTLSPLSETGAGLLGEHGGCIYAGSGETGELSAE